jgi:HD-like signal output (HDOD) protein
MRPVLEKILRDIEHVEPFSGVAGRVLEITSREKVDVDDLIDLFRTDAALTAKVLKLANSTEFGARVEITSIEHACRHVGPKALKNLLMDSKTPNMFADESDPEAEAKRLLWEESVANAVAARLLALREGYPDTELAFTAGLLQNTGHRVIRPYFERARREIAYLVIRGWPMLGAESEVLGMNHAQVGARVARRWDVPSRLVDTILHHHTPRAARFDQKLCAIGNLAEAFARRLLDRQGITGPSYGVSREALELMSGLPEDLPDFQSELSAAIGRSLDIGGVEEEPEDEAA